MNETSTYPLLHQLSALLGKNLTFVDLETTSLLNFGRENFAIIEIALIHISAQSMTRKTSLLDPKMQLPYTCQKITGLRDSDLTGQPVFKQFSKYVERFLTNDIILGFNSKTFDIPGLIVELEKLGTTLSKEQVCQLDVRDMYLIDKRLKGISNSSGTLLECAREHCVELEGQAHRASYDIELTAKVAHKLLETHGLEWAKHIFEKKISPRSPRSIAEPVASSRNSRASKWQDSMSEAKIVTHLKTQCKSLSNPETENGPVSQLQVLNLQEVKVQLGCTDSQLSFAVAKLLAEPGDIWDKYFVNRASQDFLQLHLEQALRQSAHAGKLKPLMTYLIKIDPAASSLVDYTQLRLALKLRSRGASATYKL